MEWLISLWHVFSRLICKFFLIIGTAVLALYITHLTFFGSCIALFGYQEANNLHSITFRKVTPKSQAGELLFLWCLLSRKKNIFIFWRRPWKRLWGKERSVWIGSWAKWRSCTFLFLSTPSTLTSDMGTARRGVDDSLSFRAILSFIQTFIH